MLRTQATQSLHAWWSKRISNQIELAKAWYVESLEQFSSPHLLLEHIELGCRHGRTEWVQFSIDGLLQFDHRFVVCRDLQFRDQFFFQCRQGLFGGAQILTTDGAH